MPCQASSGVFAAGTGALRDVVQNISEDGIELFRSAAEVLGSPGWQDKQRTAAERPARDLYCDSPGAERPPKHPARSRLGDRSSMARALFPARQPQQQQPQLTTLPPPPERATPPGAPIIWPSGSTESNRAAAPTPSAMEIGQPNLKFSSSTSVSFKSVFWNAEELACAFTAAKYVTIKFLSSHDIVALLKLNRVVAPATSCLLTPFNLFPHATTTFRARACCLQCVLTRT